MSSSCISSFPSLLPSSESRGRAVPHRAVAMHALDLAGTIDCARNLLVHEPGMAGHAVVLENPAALRLDHDRLVEVLQRERHRMVVAVLRLGVVLANEIVRQMAVDAGSDRMMACLLPGIELRLHDVAVHADPG